MYPSLFTIPGTDWDIRSYGFMMMLAFLIGIYLTVRRAIRVHGDPDIAINMGLMSLIGGLGGARLFYVVHYWDPAYSSNWVEGKGFFTNLFNTVWGVVDMRNGGLEFYGGMIGGILLTVLYLYLKRVSIRWYLDMIAPSLMFGAMLGRIGCYLNGCCFGRVCTGTAAGGFLAVMFPFGSHASEWQWRMHDLTVPPALTYHWQFQPNIYMYDYLRYSQKDLDDYRQKASLLSGPQLLEFQKVNNRLWFLNTQLQQHNLTMDQFLDLARQYPTKPVFPVQLFSALSAMTIWLVAEAVFRYRKRHGLVIILVLMMYAGNRFVEEFLRPDNPYDLFGMFTISQGVAIGMFLIGLIWLIITYRVLPIFSPQVRPVTLAT